MAAGDRRQAAVSFLRLASSGDALRAGMVENAGRFPNQVFEIHHTLEDGGLVAVHSRVRLNPGEAGAAVVHIFRFQGDRIVELWDTGQPVPRDSPNQAGMF